MGLWNGKSISNTLNGLISVDQFIIVNTPMQRIFFVLVRPCIVISLRSFPHCLLFIQRAAAMASAQYTAHMSYTSKGSNAT